MNHTETPHLTDQANEPDSDSNCASDWTDQPSPEDEDPPYPDPQAATKNTFELVVDLVRAQREAEPSDKWYGDLDDTYTQHNALDRQVNRHSTMNHHQLAREYEDFRFRTSEHLWVCPLVSDAVEPPPPNVGPLRSHETASLRAIAALLRTEEGARPNLTKTANGALAALYHAYANLGEALWDEHGGTYLWEDLPTH